MITTRELTQDDVQSIKRILNALRSETQPIDGHDDPGSIQDCWNEAGEIIDMMIEKIDTNQLPN